MNFKQAIEEMKKGKKVRRKGWKDVWFTLDNGGALLRNVPGSYNKKTTITGLEPLTLESVENVYANDWEVVEEKNKNKWWKPKVNEQYFYIRSTGIVDYHNCDNDKIDKLFQSFGNCFQTVKEAKFVAEKLKVIRELEKFAFENNSEEIDWNNSKQGKYYFYFDYADMSIVIDSYYICQDTPFNIYFTSKEIAEKAIKTVGEERIKKYYFGVEDE